jgi:hypothetical protein
MGFDVERAPFLRSQAEALCQRPSSPPDALLQRA